MHYESRKVQGHVRHWPHHHAMHHYRIIIWDLVAHIQVHWKIGYWHVKNHRPIQWTIIFNCAIRCPISVDLVKIFMRTIIMCRQHEKFHWTTIHAIRRVQIEIIHWCKITVTQICIAAVMVTVFVVHLYVYTMQHLQAMEMAMGCHMQTGITTVMETAMSMAILVLFQHQMETIIKVQRRMNRTTMTTMKFNCVVMCSIEIYALKMATKKTNGCTSIDVRSVQMTSDTRVSVLVRFILLWIFFHSLKMSLN